MHDDSMYDVVCLSIYRKNPWRIPRNTHRRDEAFKKDAGHWWICTFKKVIVINLIIILRQKKFGRLCATRKNIMNDLFALLKTWRFYIAMIGGTSITYIYIYIYISGQARFIRHVRPFIYFWQHPHLFLGKSSFEKDPIVLFVVTHTSFDVGRK